MRRVGPVNFILRNCSGATNGVYSCCTICCACRSIEQRIPRGERGRGTTHAEKAPREEVREQWTQLLSLTALHLKKNWCHYKPLVYNQVLSRYASLGSSLMRTKRHPALVKCTLTQFPRRTTSAQWLACSFIQNNVPTLMRESCRDCLGKVWAPKAYSKKFPIERWAERSSKDGPVCTKKEAFIKIKITKPAALSEHGQEMVPIGSWVYREHAR